MEPDYDLNRAANCALALMFLTLHEENRAWKGYPWELLDHLFLRGFICDPKNKAKSVVLTQAGHERAEEAFRQLLARAHQPPAAQIADTRKAGRPPTLTDLQQKQVATLLAPLCELPPDPAVRAQVRKGFRLDGRGAVLFEARPGFMPPHDWREEQIAKFTFVKKTQRWRLFCMLRDLKWHVYAPLPESPDLARLVEEVRVDPTCIFWG